MARRGERKVPAQVEHISLLVEKGELTPPAALAGLRQASEPLMAPTGKDDEPLFKALAELDALVGLREVKQLVHEIKAYIEIQQRRSQAGLATEPLTLHMVFKGNPLNASVKSIQAPMLRTGSGKAECPGFSYP